ncbi:uncharacterized protein LOC121788982, partial [Salvia splendens]|uniref:uncharacterized protein LOC121788982 n=1 Tax=Salvia splendens TaxID=180675 RepID=UPI001C27D0F1
FADEASGEGVRGNGWSCHVIGSGERASRRSELRLVGPEGGRGFPRGLQKSNSTGFSKIWRFKDLLGRSNSDGRDAFVFLNNNNAPSPAAKGEEKCEKKEAAAVKVSGKAKKGGKVKTAPLSAHEVYLKSKAKGEERRRSYLPYRPELMGFFTNVNGGLSKNVHPF